MSYTESILYEVDAWKIVVCLGLKGSKRKKKKKKVKKQPMSNE